MNTFKKAQEDLNHISESKFGKEKVNSPKLGSGFTRKVYDYDNDSVLKIAKNADGIQANKQEFYNHQNIDSPLIPKIIEHDTKNHKWSLHEKVKPFKSKKQYIDLVHRDSFNKFIHPKIKGDDDDYDKFNTKLSHHLRNYQSMSSSSDDLHKNDDILKHDNNLKKLKSLVSDYGVTDLHYKNLGHKDGELKILDHGDNNYGHVTRDENGKPHSFNGEPAIIHKNGTKEWRKHGEFHREDDKPTVEISKQGGVKLWHNKEGLLHREGDKPAIVSENENYENKQYFNHGMIHRDEDKPALIQRYLKVANNKYFKHNKQYIPLHVLKNS
jgi:hypothetical protein